MIKEKVDKYTKTIIRNSYKENFYQDPYHTIQNFQKYKSRKFDIETVHKTKTTLE